MALDNLVIKNITSKLSYELEGAFFDKPFALAENQFALPFHASKNEENSRRGTFIINLNPSNPFITYSFDKFTKVNINTPFFNALKKLTGTKIKKVEKLEGERIVFIEAEVISKEIDTINTGYSLIIELFPQIPNCYLIREPDQKIESIYKDKGDIFSKRYMARGMTYLPPERRKNLDPLSSSLEEISSFLSFSTRRLFEEYCKKVGFDKAREELFNSSSLYLIDKSIEPLSFGKKDAVEIKVENLYSSLVINQKELAHSLALKDLKREINRAYQTAKKKKKNLEIDLKSANQRLVYMTYGQLLYSAQDLYQKGMTSIDIEGYHIYLNKDKDLSSNAQDYFKKYKKAKSALNILEPLISKTEDEIKYLESKLIQIDKGRGQDILELKEELYLEGYLKIKNASKKTKHSSKAQPHYLTSPSYKIGFGMNAFQNETLTFTLAKKEDLFLHVKDYPSSHVVIFSDPNEDTKLLAAELSLYLSNLNSGDVYITPIKFVKKNKNKKGLVNLREYKIITLHKIRDSSLDLFKRELKI